MKRLLQLLALAVLILLAVLLYHTLTLPQADSRVAELPDLTQAVDEDAMVERLAARSVPTEFVDMLDNSFLSAVARCRVPEGHKHTDGNLHVARPPASGVEFSPPTALGQSRCRTGAGR